MGLGSNLGDRRDHLRSALGALSDFGEVLVVSSLWETEPIGGPEQGEYLNAVAVMRTVLGPTPLVGACLEIEQSRGRERRERWMPRTLDLDLLLYGAASIDVPGVVVPHPRMTERRFVLAPLAEAWPGALIPGHGIVESLLPAVADQRCVPVESGRWPVADGR